LARFTRRYFSGLLRRSGSSALRPVATPLRWRELTGLVSSDQFTVANIPERLSRLKNDPWEEYLEVRQSVTAKAMKAVGGSLSEAG
jgi:DNA primase